MTRKQLIKVAKAEIASWDVNGTIPRGLVMAILFAYVHRVTTGEDVMDSFFPPLKREPDYEI